MNIARRTLTLMVGFLKSYGPSNVKRLLWDKEFSGSKWDFIDNTAGDSVYPHLERHLREGSILDLGCGPGNTANELAATAYQTYVGVDISEAALDKAIRRTEESGRADKNRFVREDFINYVPTQQFDVILFRESIYHVPTRKVKAVLDRYSHYLRNGGVFVVRIVTSEDGGIKDKDRPKSMVRIIETEFDVVEQSRSGRPGSNIISTVIVFRSRCQQQTSPSHGKRQVSSV